MSLPTILLTVLSILISSDFSTGNKYEVPEARIEALFPNGFRVCIPDEPGIQLFAFHGTINKELPNLAAGDYSKDTLRSINGAWCFIDQNTKLRFGDVINYWTYVQVDGLGYRRDAQTHVVISFTNSQTPIGSFITEEKSATLPISETLPTLPSFPEISNINDISIEELNYKVNNLQRQVNDLIDKNVNITRELRLLEMIMSKKGLVLRGRQTDNQDHMARLYEIITQKLHIPSSQYTIVGVEQLSDGSIAFELKTISQKNNILDIWRTNKNSISDIKIEDIGIIKNGLLESQEADDSEETREFGKPTKGGGMDGLNTDQDVDSTDEPEFSLDVRAGN